MLELSPLVWGVTIAIIIALLAIDLVVAALKPHRVRFKEAAGWSIFYIAVAIGFGIWLTMAFGGELGVQYFAGYLVEKSLSVDNLFVFVIIIAEVRGAAEAPAQGAHVRHRAGADHAGHLHRPISARPCCRCSPWCSCCSACC